MGTRQIIEIDREKCNGCGLCTTACAEGALALDHENKAVLLKEIYCDGLGACLDVCPTDALRVVERDAADYNAKASYEHVKKTRGEEAAQSVHGAEHLDRQSKTLGCGCPGSMAREIEPVKELDEKMNKYKGSELSQWPIQLHLVSPHAPYFNECDLLIAADCTAFSLGGFHRLLLTGKKLVIACPKLDETSSYVEKLAELIRVNTVYSITVVIMTVPCCSGLVRIVEEAVDRSEKSIAVKKIIVNLDGSMR